MKQEKIAGITCRVLSGLLGISVAVNYDLFKQNRDQATVIKAYAGAMDTITKSVIEVASNATQVLKQSTEPPQEYLISNGERIQHSVYTNAGLYILQAKQKEKQK